MLLQAILLSLAATAFSSRSFLTAASTTAAMAGSEMTSVEASAAAAASTALLSLRSMMGSRQKAKVENSCCVLGWFCTPDSGGNTWSTIDD